MHNLITHIFPAIVKQVSWPSVHVFRVLFLENCFGEEGGGICTFFCDEVYPELQKYNNETHKHCASLENLL